jgi:gliding motility-associated-like protein
LLKRILFVILLLSAILEAGATHLVGGYIGYKYQGRVGNQVRYQVTLYVYRDCTSDVEFDDRITLCAFFENRSFYTSYRLRLLSEKKVNPVGNTNCPELREACLMQGIYTTQITLPLSSQGFYLRWERCCRNDQNNLPNGSDGRPDMGQTYQAFIPRTDIDNSSPEFLDVPVPFICANDTTAVRNRAVDANGDSLVYSFVIPWQGASTNDPFPENCESFMRLPQNVRYLNGFSVDQPFGSGGVAEISRYNGLTTYMARNAGRYAVAIMVQEYRNGVLLSTTRLDLQILVINCRPNNRPRIISPTQTTYNIRAGRQLCFDINASDQDVNDNLRLKGYGDMFTGANGWTGRTATLPDATGRRTVTSRFCWTPDCDHAQTDPYVFTVEVVDDGCPGKFINQNFLIYVQPFQSLAQIQGANRICEGESGIVYRVVNGQPGSTFQWTVTGGNITAGAGSNAITVSWNNVPTGRVVMREISAEGCPGDSVVMNVFLEPPPLKPVISGKRIVCRNTEEEFTILAAALAGNTVQTSVSGGVVLGFDPLIGVLRVRWTTKGSGFVTAEVTSATGCKNRDTLWLNIEFPETPPIIGPEFVCPNNNGFEYGVSPTTGSTYSWRITGGTQSGGGNSANILVDWGNTGVGRVQVVETDQYGCQGDTVRLDVSKTHSLTGQTPVGPVSVCEFDQMVPYSVLPKPNTTFNWTVGGGDIADGIGTQRIRVNWGARGNGFIEMFEEGFDPVNNLPCLSHPIRVPVTIHPVPVAARINGVMEVCQGSGTGVFTVSGFPGSTFEWSLNGNTNIDGQGTGTIRIPFADSGRFVLRVREVTAAGCPGPVNDTLLIVHPRPVSNLIAGNAIICWPRLTGYSYSVQGFPGSIYRWSISGGRIIGPDNTESIRVDWDDVQDGMLNVQEVSSFGCEGDLLSLPVFIDKPSVAMRRVTVTPPPADDRGILVEWELNNAPRYNNQFYIMRRIAGSTGPFTLAGIAPGTERYWVDLGVEPDEFAYDYRVMAVNLCGDTLATDIHRTILLSGEKLGRYGVSFDFTAYSGWVGGVRQYALLRQLLEKTGYLEYEIFTRPAEVDYENGLEWFSQCYRVKADENGGNNLESWSNDVCFDFEPTLFVPNAFTPNGDGHNDLFRVFAGSIRSFRMVIYNRWGEKLFQTTDMHAGWDGTVKGRPVPDGVYVAVLEYTDYRNKQYNTKETVNLMR